MAKKFRLTFVTSVGQYKTDVRIANRAQEVLYSTTLGERSI